MKIKERTRYDLRASKELLLELPLVMTKKTHVDKSVQVAAPQGSVLGLYSSRFFINDAPKVLISSETSLPLFADDSKGFG